MEWIITKVLETVLVNLPRWLISCFISPQKIADKVNIDLRSNNPIDISFGSDVPNIQIYFKISNLSLFNLVLDRLLIVDLWIGQPTLHGAILERHDVPKGIKDDVYFIEQLSSPQQEQIKKHVSNNFLSVPVKFHVKAYFESKIGLIYVEKRFEQSNIKVE